MARVAKEFHLKCELRLSFNGGLGPVFRKLLRMPLGSYERGSILLNQGRGSGNLHHIHVTILAYSACFLLDGHITGCLSWGRNSAVARWGS